MADETDVAELARLRAENFRLSRELGEQRSLLQHLIDTDLVGYLTSSFELGRFLDVNQAYCDFLGYGREELLASDPYRFWLDTTFPDDREPELALLKRVVAGEISKYRLEKRFVRKSGEVRWGEMTYGALRDERGRVRYGVIACVDVHERRAGAEAREKLQGSLLQSQKLETVGRLVGGVAHDFNNRLVVIMGHADLLRRASAHDPALASHAEIVVASARRAADLTHQLLAYSRRQVLKPRAFDLNTVVDGTRRMLERLIGERIELVTVLGAKFPTLADSGQIEQVLMNLTLNARDAMPMGGRITLETFDVEAGVDGENAGAPSFDGVPAGSYVALAVTDTGTGMSEATRAHVFEPFFTTKEAGQGTGLGLATVEGIVRQSGGAITVKSAEGVGSTFTIYLPRAREWPAESSPRDVEARVESSTGASHVPCTPKVETILVVDDEHDVRRLLVDVLRVGGYEVLEASEGDEALALAEAHPNPIALLLTDIVMPRRSGMELADMLRARYPRLKVLFMSGYAERERTRPLHESELFIPKPFLPDELFRRVNELLAEPAFREHTA